MTYGYAPFKGTEQFYDCQLPLERTAPISFWMREHAGFHAVDVAMPDGHVIRALSPETAAIYVERGGTILPDTCDHDYEREPYAGTTLLYVCTKCGDEYERDVS